MCPLGSVRGRGAGHRCSYPRLLSRSGTPLVRSSHVYVCNCVCKCANASWRLSTVAAVVACVYFSMRGDRLLCLSPVLLGWCQVLRHQSGCSPGAACALSEIWSVQIWTATAMVRFARCGERYVSAVRELTSLGYGSVLRVQAGYWLARRALLSSCASTGAAKRAWYPVTSSTESCTGCGIYGRRETGSLVCSSVCHSDTARWSGVTALPYRSIRSRHNSDDAASRLISSVCFSGLSIYAGFVLK